MNLPRQKLLARLLLAAGALLGLAWLAHLDFAQKISTDVLDLIPRDERSPELALVRGLASDEQARVALLALRLPAAAGESEAARAKRSTGSSAALMSGARGSAGTSRLRPRASRNNSPFASAIMSRSSGRT